ncbi:hypothetical protein D6U64_15085 [Vibrio cholerae]|nr:hypothetical protein [Vibrio cholerae]MVE66382.1 hypothetical protein [Vibrio cholerae]MVF00879.1 hypothetical protein [Vibrio cholerae]MVF87030.1 hypothetical protein [Vibrio cholerae]
MKAAITLKNISIKRFSNQTLTSIPNGSIVFILEEREGHAVSVVSHELCDDFFVSKKAISPIESKVLRIEWLDGCPKCSCKTTYVETKSDSNNYLFDGDKVHCARCELKGVIETYDSESVICAWDEVM